MAPDSITHADTSTSPILASLRPVGVPVSCQRQKQPRTRDTLTALLNGAATTAVSNAGLEDGAGHRLLRHPVPKGKIRSRHTWIAIAVFGSPVAADMAMDLFAGSNPHLGGVRVIFVPLA